MSKELSVRKRWIIRLTVGVAGLIAICGLCLRLLINLSMTFAIWWLLLPQPWATILSGMLNFSTWLSLVLLVEIVYQFCFKGKEEIEL